MNPTSGAQGEQSAPAPAHNGPLSLGDHQKTITMSAIAKAAGVSQGAISSLLNDRDYGIRVSDKTRATIFSICRQMGYVPNDLRAVVRIYPELGDLCLLINDAMAPADPLLLRALGAALKLADTTNVSLAHCPAGVDYEREPDRLPQPIRTGVASKFLFLGRPNLSLVRLLSGRGHRIFCIDSELELPGVSSFLFDRAQGIAVALEHLGALGHRGVAVLAEHGWAAKSPGPLELEAVHAQLDFEGGRQSARQLLARPVPPTALLALTDEAAAGALAAAADAGVRVPEALSVVGCGDGPIASILNPALTTMRLPLEEMFLQAAAAADAATRQPASQAPAKVLFPVELVVRATTAPRA